MPRSAAGLARRGAHERRAGRRDRPRSRSTSWNALSSASTFWPKRVVSSASRSHDRGVALLPAGAEPRAGADEVEWKRSSTRRCSASRPSSSRRSCSASMRANSAACIVDAAARARRAAAPSRAAPPAARARSRSRSGCGTARGSRSSRRPARSNAATVFSKVGASALRGDRIDLGAVLAHRRLERRREMLGAHRGERRQAVRRRSRARAADCVISCAGCRRRSRSS